MKKGIAIRLVGLGLLFFIAGAERTHASITVYYGCLKCKYMSIVGNAATCMQVAPLQGGNGWKCYEDDTLPWPDGPSCWVEGGLCTNGGDGGGGGSGGSAGGGTDPCAVTGFCPAQCFTCSGGGGRPVY